MGKRIISLLVVFCLLAANLPAALAAEEGIGTNGTTTETNEEQIELTVAGEYIIPDPDSLPDNDELFAAYAQREFDRAIYGDVAVFGTTAGDRLIGVMKTIYDQLKTGLAEVAKGDRNSTVFEITTELSSLSWTRAELGGVTLVADNAVTEEAKTVIDQKFRETVDTNRLLHCLLVDCPYELYWFDKTAEKAISIGYGISANNERASISIITVSFWVASPYGSGNTADTAVTRLTQTAINNAKAIVEAAAPLGSDRAILKNYKSEICTLVSYNDSATAPGFPYGDPWQLIYVFDKDTSTNVVCEGYAKAFQYLCDLTTAFTQDTVCYTVSGTMSTGGNPENHMWNVVKLGGQNLLVDVTNCDENSIGNPGKLFLVTATATENGKTHTLSVGNTSVTYSYDIDQRDLHCDGYLTLEKKVQGLTIKTAPTNTSYVAGQAFDPAGTVLTAAYTDGTSEEITPANFTEKGVTYTPDGALTTADTTVTFSMDGQTVTQSITVEDKTVSSIAVTTNPSKLSFTLGEPFTSPDLVVTATYNDGTTAVLASDAYTVSGSTDAVGDGKTATITLTADPTKTTTYTFSVTAATLTAAAPTLAQGDVSGLTVTWDDVDNAQSYTVKIYQGDTLKKTVTGADAVSPLTVDVDGIDIIRGTQYTATLTAIGDGANYLSSEESAKSSAVAAKGKTLPGSGVFSVTDNSKSYNAAQQAPTVAYTGSSYTVETAGAITIGLGSSQAAGQTDAGSYDVYVKTAGGTVYDPLTVWTDTGSDFEITKAANAVTLTGTISDNAYDGRPITSNGASATYGSPVIQYKLSTEADSAYSTVLPQYVGAYTVRAHVDGAANYEEGNSAEQTFSITAVADPATINDAATVAVGGSTVDLSRNVTGNMGQVTYAIDGDANGCAINGSVLTSGSNTGTVSVTVTVAPKDMGGSSDNEYTGKTGTITVTIQNKATETLSGVTQSGCTYGGTLPDPVYTAPAGTTATTITYEGTLHNGAAYAASAVKPTEAGSYTVTVTCETAAAIYTSAPVAFTIAPASIASKAVTLDAASKEYNGASQSVTATIAGLTSADYDVTGASGTDADTYTVTVTGKGNYTGTATATWTITPKAVTATVTAADRDYAAGQDTVVLSAGNVNGRIGSDDVQVDVSSATGTMADENAGSDKAVTVTGVKLSGTKAGNYTLSAQPTDVTVNIRKITYIGAATVTGAAKYGTTGTVDLSSFTAPGAAFGSVTVEDANNVLNGAPAMEGSLLKFTFGNSVDHAGKTAVIKIQVTGATNYSDYEITATVTVNAKANQAALTITSGTAVTYGHTLTLNATGGSGSGAVSYTVTNGTGEATIEGNVLTPVKAGTVIVTATKAEDDDHAAATSAAVTITIGKATPTGTPAYTAITAGGKTLADAGLAVGTITPAGTIKWVDSSDAELDGTTEVTANTSYKWLFTPTDTDNYNTLSGTVTLYHAPTGGSTPAPAAPVVTENPDGSVTETETAADGTVTATTTWDNGNKAVAVKSPDGGKSVTVTAANGETMVDIKLPATPIISRHFKDVPNRAWYKKAVDRAVAYGLFSGTGRATFTPNGGMTRSMLVTVLHNLSGKPEYGTGTGTFGDVRTGIWYEDSVDWANTIGVADGVSDTQFSPDKEITREQLVTMLYRYAETIGAVSGSQKEISGFPDGNMVSGYAKDAMQWAVAEGFISGRARGGENYLVPTGVATRAEVATVLVRFVEYLKK